MLISTPLDYVLNNISIVFNNLCLYALFILIMVAKIKKKNEEVYYTAQYVRAHREFWYFRMNIVWIEIYKPSCWLTGSYDNTYSSWPPKNINAKKYLWSAFLNQ